MLKQLNKIKPSTDLPLTTGFAAQIGPHSGRITKFAPGSGVSQIPLKNLPGTSLLLASRDPFSYIYRVYCYSIINGRSITI